jgi:hypothetical protein
MPNSVSSNLTRLREFLADRGIDFISDIQANRTPPVDFALSIPGDRIAELAGKGQISRRQMKLTQSSVRKELGLQIEWIVTPSRRTSSMEAALLELLEGRYPGAVSAVYISALKIAPVSIWIERNPSDRTRPELASLKSVVEQFLKLYGVEAPSVMDGDSEDYPSNPMIMRKLKVHAPVTTERLAEALRSAGLTISDLRSLQSKLDTLRKQGLLVRSNAGEYCLTELALGVVPHGKSRSSSDVERALALGRRKW